MQRLTLFAKGNVDVHDTLHSCRIGGALRWNGISDVIRKNYSGLTARVRHETWTRSDALLAATGSVPDSLAARDVPLGSYPASSQFSDAIFTTASDAVILSIQPDVTSSMLRHRTEGYYLYAPDIANWRSEDRAWLRQDFETLGLLTPEQSMSNLAAIVERLRAVNDVPVLVYNLSFIMPGDVVHCHMGLDETYPTRIRRFNLALVELSQEIGISIIDVDAVVARHGTDRLKLDTVHLTPEGYEQVTYETARVLDDIGVFDSVRNRDP
ncbi:SGNH/GDSL hydrolase family protein [Komagataeibacter sp. FNDCR2]|uniref:SGNH/GDSL hydrolase family protein n=1 Tax=Komagataeibacter sp. FNDCR2 TaxID=2878682 RepID=UPI001E3B7298|nr:SGNH/GDSL hydrolase family protein [Komagataeibacter sp. FNDCR2]MCE2574214.1 SGNH/GDSL hydrolase family protein [Komagataeibacter sp. FNDCR2]